MEIFHGRDSDRGVTLWARVFDESEVTRNTGFAECMPAFGQSVEIDSRPGISPTYRKGRCTFRHSGLNQTGKT